MHSGGQWTFPFLHKGSYKNIFCHTVSKSRTSLPHKHCEIIADLRTEKGHGLIPGSAKFFPRIDDSHCDRIHSSLTAVRCFDNGYVGQQPVARKEYCAEYWLKELQESMDKCTGRRDITEILLKSALNTIQTNKQIVNSSGAIRAGTPFFFNS